MDVIEFEVSGEPVAQGRGRVGINRATGRATVFTPAKTKRAEDRIWTAATEAMGGRPPLEGPLVLEVWAYRAKGLPGKADAKPGSKAREMYEAALNGLVAPTTKPDGSNYLKAAEDACNGVVYRDDALIVDVHCYKRYSGRPRLVIRVEKWRPAEP